MTTLTRDDIKNLRNDINAALAAVAARHGLEKLEAGNCTFDAHAANFTFKLAGNLAGGLSKEAKSYEDLRHLFPAMPELGALVTVGTLRQAKIIGADARGRKAIIEKDGKRYTIKADAATLAAAAKLAAG